MKFLDRCGGEALPKAGEGESARAHREIAHDFKLAPHGKGAQAVKLHLCGIGVGIGNFGSHAFPLYHNM